MTIRIELDTHVLGDGRMLKDGIDRQSLSTQINLLKKEIRKIQERTNARTL